MNIRSTLTAAIAAALTLSANGAFAQANVVETQANRIVVDANAGSDAAMGTVSAPVRTLSAAVAKAVAASTRGIGATITINPGIYREALDISGSGGATAPITIEAASGGATVLSGSDVVRGWAHSYGSVYVHSWSWGSTGCSVPSGWPSGSIGAMARQNAMIFVNGHSLTQVGSKVESAGKLVLYRSWTPPGLSLAAEGRECQQRDGGSRGSWRGVEYQPAKQCRPAQYHFPARQLLHEPECGQRVRQQQR